MKQVVAVVAWAGFLATDTGTAAPERTRLIIEIRNVASVPPKTVAGAQRVAGRILRRAGIEARWLECTAGSDAPCSLPGVDRAGLALSILPHVPANLPKTTMGVAFTSTATPVEAYVFYPRVMAVADANRITSATELLAIAAVHELGHLLLGKGEHSAAGLMKARWSRSELQMAVVGRLQFSSEQSARMRSEVARRAGTSRNT